MPGHDETELHLADEEGNEIVARIFGAADPDQPADRYLNDMLAFAYCQTSKGKTGMAYTQQLQRSSSYGLPFGGIDIEQPLVDPVLWGHLYRTDPVNHACCDAKVEYIVGQGYRIRPAQEIFGANMPIAQLGKEPDEAQRKVALDFFLASEPDYSFGDMTSALELDMQAGGNAYMELLRDNDRKLIRLARVPAETMRIELNNQGFMQARDTRYQFWPRYGTKVKSVTADLLTSGEADKRGYDRADRKRRRYVSFQAHEPRDMGDYFPVGQDAFGLLVGQAKGESAIVTGVNEMIHFQQPSPRDSNYGEPAIAAAVEDHLLSKNQRQFMAMHFDRGMLPRLAILVQGRLSEKVVKTIQSWAQGSARLEAANSVLVIELPPETEAKFDKLSSEVMNEGAFMGLREMSDGAVKMAHRVPDSIVQTAANSNRAESAEANAKFITGVVRPTQMKRAEKYNMLLREELGVTDWVVDFNIPDLESEQIKAQVTNILMNQGVLSINEVRRLYNHAPITGCDIPILKLGGGQAVLVTELQSLANASNRGARGQEALDALPEQQKGAVLLPGESHCTLLLPIPLNAMNDDQRREMAGIVKGIGVWNEDDIAGVFGIGDTQKP